MIGALFARSAGAHGGAFHIQPAIFAVCLAVADTLFAYMYLQETLPAEKRVRIDYLRLKKSGIRTDRNENHRKSSFELRNLGKTGINGKFSHLH